ncbi:histidine kinase [Streptomyces lavendulae]|uniref:histidine kinase n=1 Tax=Streptomyces lavendulae TaxID=1914 RepID=UPI0036A87ED7
MSAGTPSAAPGRVLHAVRSPGPRTVDAGLAAAALADAWTYPGEAPWTTCVPGVVAALALLARRRGPVAVFAFALIPMQFGGNVATSPAALFSLAERGRGRRVPAASVPAYAIRSNLPELDGYALRDLPDFAVAVAYSLTTAGLAVLLGRLVLTRREPARNTAGLRAAQEHQRDLHAQAVLAREHAHLAREMHDVVSHQVSLIAVRAGALQVSADSTDTKEAARTIRTLSAATLDELRHMVGVCGPRTAPPPAPTPGGARGRVWTGSTA